VFGYLVTTFAYNPIAFHALYQTEYQARTSFIAKGIIQTRPTGARFLGCLDGDVGIYVEDKESDSSRENPERWKPGSMYTGWCRTLVCNAGLRTFGDGGLGS
jgi:hypothetical protein